MQSIPEKLALYGFSTAFVYLGDSGIYRMMAYWWHTDHTHDGPKPLLVLLEESQTKVKDYYTKENKKLYIKASLNI